MLAAAPTYGDGFGLGVVELMVMLLTPVGTCSCPSPMTLTTAWPVVEGVAEVLGTAAALELAGGAVVTATTDDDGAAALGDGAAELDEAAAELDGGAALDEAGALGILRVIPTVWQND